MRQHLLPSVVAFVIGVSVGSYAAGYKGESGSAAPPETEAGTPVGTPVDPPANAADKGERQRPRSEIRVGGAIGEAREAEGLPDLGIGSMDLEEQMSLMTARWANLEARIDRLNVRLGSLERGARSGRPAAEDEAAGREDRGTEALPTDTPEDRRTALVIAGVAEDAAEAIVWRQSELDLQRLDLQDRAIREGWDRTDRYFEELRAINRQGLDLRAEIGEETYDRYLYQTGESNRVKVSAVMQGSQGEQSGLLPGDLIESYDGERIFSFGDLRSATTTGVRDEPVPVMIRRGEELLETWMARGPIGIRLETATAAPDT